MARPLSITNNNSVTLTTSTKKFGSAGANFRQSESPAAYLVIPNAGEFDFGTGNFTIEWWYYLNATAEAAPNFLSTTNWVIRAVDLGVTNDTNLIFENNPSGTGNDFTYDTGNTNITQNAWHHYAVVRNGNTLDWYIDGTKVGAGQSVTGISIDSGSELRLGIDYALTLSKSLENYMDDFRISNVARYTGNFTAPTAAHVDDANTLVLLNFDGSNGSTTIVDRVNITGASSVSVTSSLTATGRDAPFVYLDDDIPDQYTWSTITGDTWESFANDYWDNSPTNYTWDTVPGDQWTGFWYDRWLINGLLVAGQSTVNATATLIKYASSSMSAEATVTVQGNYQLSGQSNLTATASLSAQGSYLRSASADLSSSASVTVDALSLVLGSASLSVIATVTAESQPYILASASLAVESTVTVSAEEFDLATANLSVETALTARGGYFLTGTSSISSETALTAKGGYFVTASSNLSASASVVSGSDKFVPGASSMSVISTVNADATKFVRGESGLSSSASVSVLGGIRIPASANLAVESSVTVSAMRLKVGSIVAYNFASLSADARMNLVGASDLSAVSSVSASAGRILDIANDYYPYTWDTVPGDVWTGFPDDQWGVAGLIVFSLGEISATATIVKQANANLFVTGSLSVDALNLVRGTASLSAVASITVSPTVEGSANLSAQATASAIPSLFVGGRVDLQAFAFQVSLGVRTLGGRANLSAVATLSAEGNFILLDSVYLHKILRETRQFGIKDESRNLDILSETRSYMIPDESRLQDILAESRSINTVELDNG